MNGTNVLDALIAAAVLIFVVYRQTVARPVSARGLLIFPVILGVLGVVSLSHLKAGSLTGTAVGWIVVDGAWSLVAGAVRGCFVRVFGRDGVMWRQGGRITIVLWLVSVAGRVVIYLLADHAGVGTASTAAIDLTFGISLLAQSVVVAWRGSRMGLPFAPSQGRGGGIGRMG